MPLHCTNCVRFRTFRYNSDLRIEHTWFEHKKLHKLTFYPNSEATPGGRPRDIDHVLLNLCRGRPGADLGLRSQTSPRKTLAESPRITESPRIRESDLSQRAPGC